MAKSIYITHKAYYNYIIREGSMCFHPDMRFVLNSQSLFESLKRAFDRSIYRYDLLRQLRKYMLLINDHMLTYSFQINKTIYGDWDFENTSILEKKILLYGAGNCGQAFFQYAYNHKKQMNIVGWVDSQGDTKNEECLHKILFPDSIRTIDFDILAIAIRDEQSRNDVLKRMVNEYHVAKDKIVFL